MCAEFKTESRAIEEKNLFAVKKAYILSKKALVLQEGVCVQWKQGHGGGWEVRCWAEERWISWLNHLIHTSYTLITLWKEKNNYDICNFRGAWPELVLTQVLFVHYILDIVNARSKWSKANAAENGS